VGPCHRRCAYSAAAGLALLALPERPWPEQEHALSIPPSRRFRSGDLLSPTRTSRHVASGCQPVTTNSCQDPGTTVVLPLGHSVAAWPWQRPPSSRPPGGRRLDPWWQDLLYSFEESVERCCGCRSRRSATADGLSGGDEETTAAKEVVDGLVNGGGRRIGRLDPEETESAVARVWHGAGGRFRTGRTDSLLTRTFLVVGRGIDPRTSRFSGARSTN
jgi:hypothetical protein